MVRFPKKALTILLVVFAVLVLGTLFITCLYYISDDAPPEDQDLEFVYVPVDNDENGFLRVPLDAEAVYWSLEFDIGDTRDLVTRMIGGTDWNEELAAQILSENAEALRAFGELLKYPAFQFPEIRSGEDSPKHYWAKVVRPALIRCESLFRRGNKRAALDGTIDVMRLGHRIQGANGHLIDYALGSGIRSIGLQVFDRMLPAVELKPEELDVYRARVSRLQPDPQHIADVVRFGYQFAKQGLRSIQGEIPRSALVVNFNRTLGMLADYYRAVLKAMRGTAKDWPELPEKRDPDRLFGVIPEKNATGKIMFQMTREGGEILYLGVFEDKWLVSKSLLLIALKRFHEVTGTLPETLGGLVPDHISQVPIDPYDGQPIRYSRLRRIIWSVGMDVADSEGHGDDLVVKIPF